MNKNNNEKGRLMPQITTLTKELKKYELTFDKENLARVYSWFKFWYRSDYEAELISEIINYGKCVCGMSKWVIDQEYEADNMKHHLECEGCNKKCDGGSSRENDEYSFSSHKCGAYVFYKCGKSVEEYYCENCKFELLCGDCGAPHELDADELAKLSEIDNFYTCHDCIIKQEEEEHDENHAREPSWGCWLCHDWADQWDELVAENEKKIANKNPKQNSPIK